MDTVHQIIFIAGALFLISILATTVTPRLGTPLLLVFLVIGMLAGEDGPGNIHFENYQFANLLGTAALAVILFDGGMRTRMETFRVALKPALSLATIGVVLTALAIGVVSAALLHLSLTEGMLLGAIVSSTDAAAVFSLLRSRSVSLNQRVGSTLEIESGTNDAIAVCLTLSLIHLLMGEAHTLLHLGGFFLLQFGGGALLGVIGGFVLSAALNRLELGEPLYPLLALFAGLLIYGATASFGGSGFLAVYIAGLVLGNRRGRASASIRRFHNGIAWLAQIGLFLMLGLLVTPSALIPLAPAALLISATLMLVARPAAVFLCLLPFRFAWREQFYVAWVGLRGSVPIVLATYPWLAGLEHAGLYFDITFFIVLISLIVQGWTVSFAADVLDVKVPQSNAVMQRIDLDLPGQHDYEVVSYELGQSSALLGRRPRDLPMPDGTRVIGLSRDGKLLPRGRSTLQAGDYLSLLVNEAQFPDVERLLQSVKETPENIETAYYGALTLDPAAPYALLVDTYNVPVERRIVGDSIEDLVTAHLPKPVVGDRLKLGPIELTVRQMEGDRITEVGLRLPSGQRTR